MNTNGIIKWEETESYTDNKFVSKDANKKKKSGEKRTKNDRKDPNPGVKQGMITDHMPVEKKKRKVNRFNGMAEEEVLLRTLPDHLAPNLDIVIIGINPGLMAAYIGHHYAGPGNHFWKCLYLSGLVPEPMNCYDDFKLKEFGIGFTNICARATRGSADLKRPEIKEGAEILKEKLRQYKPKIAAFNGKGIYEIFSGNKKMFFGKQADLIEGTDTIVYVMPSSSARCAQLPRALDKVPFYEALRKLRDHLNGRLPHLNDAEITFPNLELKCKKEEPDFEDDSQENWQASGSDSFALGTNSLVESVGRQESERQQKIAIKNMQAPRVKQERFHDDEQDDNLTANTERDWTQNQGSSMGQQQYNHQEIMGRIQQQQDMLEAMQQQHQQQGMMEAMQHRQQQDIMEAMQQHQQQQQQQGFMEALQQHQQQQGIMDALQQQQGMMGMMHYQHQQQGMLGMPYAFPVTTAFGPMMVSSAQTFQNAYTALQPSLTSSSRMVSSPRSFSFVPEQANYTGLSNSQLFQLHHQQNAEANSGAQFLQIKSEPLDFHQSPSDYSRATGRLY